VGKDSPRVATNRVSENYYGLGSGEAHDVSSSPQEDCGVSTGKVGEVEGGKKGGIESRD
jgi:hypothetical protein